MKQMLERPWNVVPSQFMVRRDVFERCGGFHERSLRLARTDISLLMAREHGYFRLRSGICCCARPRARSIPRRSNARPAYDLFVELVRERYGARLPTVSSRNSAANG